MFFHGFTLIFSNMLVLTLSSICLLILPMSVLDGLIRRHEILSGNPSLWSLIEMYASLSSNICIRSSSFNLLAIFFALLFVFVLSFFISSCYVAMHKLFITGLIILYMFLDLSADINKLLVLCISPISLFKTD